jgi:hypothetical protein
MPDVQEVFRVATQKVRPDAGALDRQQTKQRQRTTRRRVGAYAVAAALIATIAFVAVRAGLGSIENVQVGGQPSSGSSVITPKEPVATVTSNGSTCSIVIRADRIEPGYVSFEVVNTTPRRLMVDSWMLAEGYRFGAFERAVARDLRFAERGQDRGAWPADDQVTYLRSDVIPAHSSVPIAVPLSTGTNAITCLKPFEGLGFRAFGIAGPIVVR